MIFPGVQANLSYNMVKARTSHDVQRRGPDLLYNQELNQKGETNVTMNRTK